MRTRRFVAAAALVALAAVSAACGDDDSSTSTPGGSDGNETTAPPTTEVETCTAERAGGELGVAAFSEPRSLDPLPAGGGATGSNELAALYDVLMRYDPGSGTFEPWLAESLEPDAAFTTWTLKLRPGVTFSNGDAYDAAAVEFSVRRHQSAEGRSQQRSLVQKITTMTVVDAQTLRFQLDGPWPGFPYVLSGPVGMVVNPKVVTTLDSTGFPPTAAGVGAGPFVLEAWKPKESITMTGRDGYWGGTVCIDRLRFVVSDGGPKAYESLTSGAFDSVFVRNAEIIDTARTDDVSMHSTLGGAGEVLLLNNGVRGAVTPTTDVRVRQAIAHAIDVEAVDERMTGGHGLATSALMPEQSRFYQGLDGPEYDPDRAAELVQQVIAEGKWDGTVRFECDNSPARQAQALAVKTFLEVAGFKVQLNNNQDINGMIQKVVVNADFDISCFGFNVTDQSPWAKLDRLLGTGSASNYAGYSNPQFDAALVELRQASDDDETKAALAEVQEIWTETVPSAVIAAAEEVVMWNDDVHGVVPTSEAVVIYAKAWVG